VNLHSRIQSSTAAFSTPFNTGIQCAHRINAPHEVTRSDNDYESLANRERTIEVGRQTVMCSTLQSGGRWEPLTLAFETLAIGPNPFAQLVIERTIADLGKLVHVPHERPKLAHRALAFSRERTTPRSSIETTPTTHRFLCLNIGCAVSLCSVWFVRCAPANHTEHKLTTQQPNR
jgi:hypothetical protein